MSNEPATSLEKEGGKMKLMAVTNVEENMKIRSELCDICIC
jgi:hypothetical protein